MLTRDGVTEFAAGVLGCQSKRLLHCVHILLVFVSIECSCNLACGDLSGDSSYSIISAPGFAAGSSLLVVLLVLAFVLLLRALLAFALADSAGVLVDSADCPSLSRAMMMLRISSRTRGYVERRASCMSKLRLRSSSSMPVWTTAIFTRLDKTSPQVRSYPSDPHLEAHPANHRTSPSKSLVQQ